MTDAPPILLREACADDAAALANIYCTAVMAIPVNVYALVQKTAWIIGKHDPSFWQQRLAQPNRHTVVAVYRQIVVGFIEYQADQDYIDCLYVSPHHQRQGVASALLKHVMALPRDKRLNVFTVQAAHPAVPFFRQHGFQWVRENHILCGNVILTNHTMRLTQPL